MTANTHHEEDAVSFRSPMTMPFTDDQAYERAMSAEPRLRPIAELVDVFCELARPSDTMCAGCVWEHIVKPLMTPLVGWSRGCQPRQAEDPSPNAPRFCTISAEELVRRVGERSPAVSATETWLRTSQAYDAVMGEWLARLDAADPANGHGIRRCAEDR